MSVAQADEPAGGAAKKPAKETTASKAKIELKPQVQKPKGDQANPDKQANSDKKVLSGNKPMSSKPTPADQPNGVNEPLSPQREAAAVLFAQQHHAELAELLNRLQASHREQYTKAIRELDRTRERLEKVRERDADRYAILLREWQLDSRVRLLAARMTMGGTPELETELRQVLLERHDVRLQLLTYDRERSKTRLTKLDEQIVEHVQNRETDVDREFDKIKRNADTRKRSLPNKPANKRPSEK
ncbi:MAG TPA: hypothetical protein VK137_04710 [Planctomycetaceae bacterium]|nr:hypothetical protein [Planctomycetaceae bacterium]